jgi:DNA-binding CsgD family transcriptional regulator
LNLSPQQQRVVALVRTGASYEQIGQTLGVDRRTVATYVDRIARKIPNPEQLRPYLAVFVWSRLSVKAD